MERAPAEARAGVFGQAGRLRTAVMIAVFDLGGPLLAYSLLRDLAHLPTVAALILSGLFPALGVACERTSSSAGWTSSAC